MKKRVLLKRVWRAKGPVLRRHLRSKAWPRIWFIVGIGSFSAFFGIAALYAKKNVAVESLSRLSIGCLAALFLLGLVSLLFVAKRPNSSSGKLTA